MKKKRVENMRYPVHTIYVVRCRSSWGEPERGRADIALRQVCIICGQMRPLAPCLALSCVAYSLYIGMACRYFPSHTEHGYSIMHNAPLLGHNRRRCDGKTDNK